MRQTRLFEEKNPERNNGRITRGHSDLPKQQEQEESVEEDESLSEEEEDDGVPKVKKIHHMTLKAIQRKKQLAELAALQGITIEQKPVVKIPKKRGRPKGYTKKPVTKQEDSIINEIQLTPLAVIPQKKQAHLRKRDSIKKVVEDGSQQMVNQNQVEIQELKEVEMEIKLKPAPPKSEIQEPIQPPTQTVQPNCPKKRGRKKKIQPQLSQSTAVLKVFTVPKSQTYDNYNKYYRKITEELKQENGGVQTHLIFDKLNNSEGYEQLLRAIQLKK